MKSNFFITYSDIRTNMSLIFQKADCLVVLCKRLASEQTIVNTLTNWKSLYLDSAPPGLSPRALQGPQGVFVGRPAAAACHCIVASECQRLIKFLRSVPAPEGHWNRRAVSFPF